LSLYEKGMQLVKAASQSLDVAEQRVAVVSESGEVQELSS
jgi:exonuclease VII small subunit